MAFIDLTGQRFGKLEVLERVANRKSKARWLCQCDCGARKEIQAANLRNGNTRSCGCGMRTHGMTGMRTHGMTSTPEYGIWKGMKRRCLNPRDSYWENYGGRGISICERWLNSFENFYADMGKRPSPDLSIDRYPNNDGNYEPANCRWATKSQQNANRRRPTHCPRGHPLSGDNVRKRSGWRSTHWECRICRSQAEQKRKNMSRAAKRLSCTPLILLNDIPPLIPHACLPSKWPPTTSTAAILAQKALRTFC